jgi:WD40 repeat protein
MILPPSQCLESLAKEHHLSPEQKEVFIARFSNDSNVRDREVADKLEIGFSAYRNRWTGIYKKFKITDEYSRKFKELEKKVNTKCGIPFSPILKEYLDEMSPVYRLYGRDDDLNKLLEHTKKCRLITIRGMKGIGKTALAVKLVEKVKELSEFEYIIWSDLRRISSFDELIDNLIKVFDISSGKNKTKQLINHFQQHKCLLILDDVTAVVKLERAEYDKYLNFVKDVAKCTHKSCLILTGYEFSEEIKNYTDFHGNYYDLEVKGLDIKAAEELLQSQEDPLYPSSSTEEGKHIWQDFVDYYAGNPKVLQIAASYIRDFYDGSLEEFIEPKIRHGFLSTSEAIEQLLNEQFERLNDVSKQIMYWLAIENEPVTREQIENNFPLNERNIISGEIPRLLYFSLIEKRYDNVKTKSVYTQVPMIMDYVTEKLINEVFQEIITRKIKLLNYHSLIKAQAKDYIRDVQISRILEPLKKELIKHFQDNKELKKYLFQMLEEWRNKELLPGYFAGNIINLLRQLNEDLSERDFSNLVIWQANFQGIDLRSTNFTNSDLRKSSFSETLSSILSVSFSSTGCYFATGEANGDIRLWLTQDLTQLDIKSKAHSSQVWSLAFSPNQNILVSCSEDGTLNLWSIVLNNKLHCIHKLDVPSNLSQCWRSVVFSPDGKFLASAGDKCVVLWDLETYQILETLPITEVHSIAFCDEYTLISGSQDGVIRIWNVNSSELLQEYPKHSKTVRCVAFNPHGNRLASGGEDGNIYLWNIDNSLAPLVLQEDMEQVWAIAFSQDGKFLASGSTDTNGEHIIKIWNLDNGQCQLNLGRHNRQLRCLSFCSTNNKNHPHLLVSGGDDRTIKLWDTNTGRCQKTLQGYTNRIWSVNFNSDDKKLASSGEDHKILLWDINTGKCERIFSEHTDGIWSVKFSPDDKMLASCSEDNEIRLWDITNNEYKCINILKKHTERVRAIAFSPDGKTLASGGNDRSVILWDVKTGKIIQTLDEESGGHHRRVLSLAFSPDGSLVASSSRDQTIRLWNPKFKKIVDVSILEGHKDQVHSIAFSPNGKQLISGSFDTTLMLWDVTNLKPINTFKGDKGHKSGILSVSFHPTKPIVASGGHDQTIKLWDVNTGECLKTLDEHEGAVESISFSKDPSILVSSSQDQTIRIWDIKTGECRVLEPDKPYKGMKITNAKLSISTKSTLIDLGASEY